MAEKYPVVTVRTGYNIYHDEEFEITNTNEDYHKIIHREIIRDNCLEVLALCKWIYCCDRSFPCFDEMMEIAIKKASYKMFVLVLYVEFLLRRTR